MILIIGGSGSGKSAYAEQTALRKKNGCALYYLATMQIYDAEGEKKWSATESFAREKVS